MNLIRPKITVLTPVFNEEGNLDRYFETTTEVLISRTDLDISVMFIDDGSSDGSWRKIEEICKRNAKFSGLRLSRNFGAHVALSAGFHHASGNAVATLACDLQDPPETIIEFVEKWRNGTKIVWGKRRTREDKGWRILMSRMFFFLIRKYAMPKGSKFTTGSFLLADQLVVDAYRKFKESNRVTFALMAWTGFEQDVVFYDRRRREAGVSGWNFFQMTNTMYDTLIGFSDLPIKMMTLTGVLVSIANIPLTAFVLLSYIFERPLEGWTSTMLIISIFFGIHFLLMGLTGEYLRRIYAESLRRPLYFICESANSEIPHG